MEKKLDKQTNQTLDDFLNMPSTLDDQPLPNNTTDATPWMELPFDVIHDLMNSTTIESDEDQKQRISEFFDYDVFSEIDMRKKFPKFPDHYYKYLTEASQQKFKAFVKEDKEEWQKITQDVSFALTQEN